jgi:hypothetical protein
MTVKNYNELQQTKFNFLKFGYYNLQVCQFILRFNKLEMQNDERDNKNGNRKNEKNKENCHSLSPRCRKESRGNIKPNL